MDLSTLDTSAVAEEGAVMTVCHPTTGAVLVQDDGETPITITLAGSDSPRFLKAQRANTNKRLSMRGRRNATLTAEELDQEGLELLAACTIAWDGIVLDAEKMECTEAKARKVYRRLPWLREQVDQFIGDRSNFLKGSSPTSSPS